MLADYVLVDNAGKLSIIGIFDRLFAAPFPSLHPQLFIVARWTGGPSKAEATEIRAWSPGGELLVGAQQPLEFGPDGKANTIARLSPLPLPGPGDYTLELLAGGASIHHIPLAVESAPS
jgi:hypothetical protein